MSKVKRIENKFEIMMEYKQKVKQLENQIFLSRDIIKEKFLKDLIWDGYSYPNELLNRYDSCSIRLIPDQIVLQIIRLEDYLNLEQEVWEGSRELLKYAVSNVIQEVLNNFDIGETFCNMLDEYIIVYGFNQTETEKGICEKLDDVYKELYRCVEQCFNVAISVGESDIGHGYPKLNALYKRAEEAFQYVFVKGKGSRVEYCEVVNKGEGEPIDIHKKVKLLKSILQSVDDVNAITRWEGLTFSEAQKSITHIPIIKNVFQQYYSYIMEFSYSHNIYDHIKYLLLEFQNNLIDHTDLNELSQWIYDVLNKIVSVIKTNSHLICTVKQYVNQHYQEGISLSCIADSVGISQSYLSRIFAREMGMNFVYYLIDFRIKMAMSLIEETNLKMCEIASQVGYPNYEHFSRIFKKVTEKSPKQYMQLHREFIK